MTRTPRAFTLVELALATVLGAIVLLAAFSIFSSLGSADALGQEAFEEANAAANAHEAITIALQTLAMSNTIPPPRNAQGERTRPGRDAEDPSVGVPDAFIDEPARLLLEPDDSQPAMMEDPGSSTGELMRPQRLELTLRARPVFVFGDELDLSVEDIAAMGYSPAEAALDAADRAAGSPGARGSESGAGGPGLSDQARDQPGRARSDRRPSRSSGSDRRAGDADRADPDGPENAEGRDEPGAAVLREDDDLGVTTELVQGVRGAFELEFDPGVDAGGREPQAGWVLWWRQIYPVVEAPLDMDPLPGQDVGRTRLMGNIASAAWNVLYTKRAGAGQASDAQRLREHVAIWSDDLPGYLELDLIMNSGTRYQWTFEVNWGVSGEPGTIASVTAPPTQPGAAAGVLPPANAGAGLNSGAGADRAADRARTPTGGSDQRDRPRRSGGRSPSSRDSTSGEERRR